MAMLNDIFGAGGIAALGGKIADIVKSRIPDVNQQAQVQADLQKMLAEQDFDLQKGQLDINKVEAASGSLFVAGARPAVLWVGVVALALMTWPKAIVLTVFWCIQAWHTHSNGGVLPPYPDLGTTDVIMLMGSLLGIGGLRTAEKFKGVATMGTK